MKYHAVAILLVLVHMSFGQDLFGSWSMDQMIIDNAKSLDTISLYKLGKNAKKVPIHIYVIKFNDDGTFNNSYVPPCLNDCLTSTFGIFELVGSQHVQLVLKSYYQTGTCKNLYQELDENLGLYKINYSQDTESIVLTKTPEM